MTDKLLDKVKFFMGIDSVNEADDDNEEIFGNEPIKDLSDAIDLTESIQNNYLKPSKKYSESKVNSMDNKETSKINVTILKPADFNDAAVVVNNLKLNKPVVMNLEGVEKEIRRKIFDFCSGALFALEGKMFKISRNVFLLASKNVDISGNLNNSVESDYEME